MAQDVIFRFSAEGAAQVAVATDDLAKRLERLEAQYQAEATASAKASSANTTYAKSANTAGQAATSAASGVNGFNNALRNAAQFAAGLTAFNGLAGAFQSVVTQTANAEKQLAVLTNLIGELRAATTADEIRQFAATTNFSVNEAIGSFTKLASRGFEPTIDELRALGDVANSQGKSLDQFVEAVLDAATGQNERLKEFGIVADASGANVAFTFNKVRTEVEKTPAAITDYLLSLGKVQGVQGITAKIAQTLGGQLSNLGDLADFAAQQIGQKLRPAFSALIAAATGLLAIVVRVTAFVADNAKAFAALGLTLVGLNLNSIAQGFVGLGASILRVTGITAAYNAVTQASAKAAQTATTALAAETVATNVQAAATARATVTLRGLWAAFLSNPLGIVIAAVTAAYAAYEFLANNISLAEKAQRDYSKALSEVDEKVIAATGEVNVLFNELGRVNKELETSTTVTLESGAALSSVAATIANDTVLRRQQSGLIGQINQQYGEYLPKLIDEKTTTTELAIARRAAVAELEKEVRLQGLRQVSQDVSTALAKNELALKGARQELQLVTEIAEQGGLGGLSAQLSATGGDITRFFGNPVADARVRVRELTAENEVLTQQLRELTSQLINTESIFGATAGELAKINEEAIANGKALKDLQKDYENLTEAVNRFREAQALNLRQVQIGLIPDDIRQELQNTLLELDTFAGEANALLAEALRFGDPALIAKIRAGVNDALTATSLEITEFAKKRNVLLSTELRTQFEQLSIDTANGLYDVPTFQARIDELFTALRQSVNQFDIENIAPRGIVTPELIIDQDALGGALDQFRVSADDVIKAYDDYIAKLRERQQKLKDAILGLFVDITKAAQTFNQIELDRANQAVERQRVVIDSIRERQQAGEKFSADEVRANEERLRELERQRAEFVRRQQALAQVEITANTIIAVTQAIRNSGGNPVLAGIQVAGILALFVASLAAARAQAQSALPGFADGVVDYQGAGTSRSDSNVVRISRGESIINAEATARNKGLLEAINNGLTVTPQLRLPGNWSEAYTTTAALVQNQRRLEGKLDRLADALSGNGGAAINVMIGEADVARAVARHNAKTDRIKSKTTYR